MNTWIDEAWDGLIPCMHGASVLAFAKDAFFLCLDGDINAEKDHTPHMVPEQSH